MVSISLYSPAFQLSLISFIYALFLWALFTGRKKIKSLELKVFTYLINLNILSFIFQYACLFVVKGKGMEDPISIFILKTFLIFLAIYNGLFLIYIIVITLSEREKELYYNKIKLYCVVFISFVFAFIFALDLRLIPYSQTYYFDGNSVFALIFSTIMAGVVGMGFMIYGRMKNHIPLRKYVPVIILDVGLTVLYLVLNKIHAFYLIPVFQSFTLLYMNFTIENPDVDVIEELAISMEESKKANRVKLDFINSISHEVRAPINSIIRYAEEIMELNKEKQDNHEIINEQLQLMKSSNNYLLELVGSILEVNQMESSKQGMEESEYSIRNEINNLIKVNSFRIQNKNLEVNVECNTNVPEVIIGDVDHVKETINHLLSNAIKFTEKGYITIRVDWDQKKANVGNLNISIIDSGSGMPDDVKESILLAFKNDNSQVSGGLGLPISKHLVERMGGTLSFESEVGKGSTFVVSIPQKVGK